MSSRIGNFVKEDKCVLVIMALLMILTGTIWAQTTASMKGTVRDTSGAVVPDATVTVKSTETGSTRVTKTDANGSYNMVALPIGQYEVTVEKLGFKQTVRRGINLVVGQTAVLDLALEIGAVEQEVTVTAEAPLVNTTTSSTSGLISEAQVKDLPLNGRSFDQLLTLNAGTANYSADATPTTAGNAFSVSGRRPDENRFLFNGIDYVGVSNGLHTTPYGSSGQVLGVEAVREFNLLTDTYGAEYGKRSGGQVSIVTASGSNLLHGSAFEFLRNSKLDARNFYDQPIGLRIPPFKRNQFGGSLGGPIKKDKLFLFGSYEGFRQRLGTSNKNVVPDAQARQGFLPDASGVYVQVPNLKPGMLPYMNLWLSGNGAELLDPVTGHPTGTQFAFYNPVQAIREDYGVVRFDYTLSNSDSLSGSYMVDNGETGANSAFTQIHSSDTLQSSVVSLQETKIFSPRLLNVVTLGYTRAYTFAGATDLISLPANLRFVTDASVGSFAIGGGVVTATGNTTVSSATGAGRPTFYGKNLYTITDDVHYTKGNHSWGMGFWFMRNQDNTGSAPTNGNGGISYPTLQAMLQDAPSVFQGVSNLSPLAYRTTEAAWYIQDDMKLRPNLSLRLGLRDEITNGFNEASCRAANYGFDSNGIINTSPTVGCSALSQNNALSLWEPRVGLAWDPNGTGKWSVRAGFSITHDVQDELVHRLYNPPLNGVISIRNTPLLSFVPIKGGVLYPGCTSQLVAANSPCSIYSPGGVEPNFHTPTIQQWSFTIERQLTKDLMLRVGYVGSEDYHMLINMDMNIPIPVVCNNPAGCLNASGGVGTVRGTPAYGTTYVPFSPTSPTNSGMANPFVSNTYSWFFAGVNRYHAANVSLVKRMSAGLTFKANYSFSKLIDDMSANTGSTGVNEPYLIWNRYNIGLNKGSAAFNLRHQFSANFSYELPFGLGKALGSGATGVWDKVISGWQWNGIITAQGGFPTTPQVGRNISGTGDTRNPDVPDFNPAFKGPIVQNNPNQWYNPRAFILPIPGTFGNAGRGAIRGPGLTSIDTSFFKKIPINERFNLQFRAEMFNILNHTNFGNPSPIVFSGNAYSATAGVISKTATTSRQIQFALRLTF